MLAGTKNHLTFVDTLFSSAIAVCVTELAVIVIGKDMSLIGQVITIVISQYGGLGGVSSHFLSSSI